MNAAKQVAKIIMTFLFLWAASVQLNDPDPEIWVGIYVGTGLLTALAQGHRLNGRFAALISIVAFCGAAWLATNVIGQQHVYEAEEGREMMGLGLICVWFAVLAFWGWPKKRAALDR